MYQVTKRDGKIAGFDIAKISAAIKKAFDACDRQYNDNIIDFLALKVTSDFEPKIENGIVAVEDIQDSVETVLVQAGYADVAKAYILYRRQREKVRNLSSTMLDYKGLVDNYLKINDWRVKENSTVTYSVGGFKIYRQGGNTALCSQRGYSRWQYVAEKDVLNIDMSLSGHAFTNEIFKRISGSGDVIWGNGILNRDSVEGYS